VKYTAWLDKDSVEYTIEGTFDHNDHSLALTKVLYNGEVDVLEVLTPGLEGECYWELWNSIFEN